MIKESYLISRNRNNGTIIMAIKISVVITDWTFVSHKNSCVEALTFNMIVFGSGTFGR